MLRLKFKRIEKGITQKTLSQRTGLAKNTICAYEIGERRPKKSTLVKIARELGCEVADIE